MLLNVIALILLNLGTIIQLVDVNVQIELFADLHNILTGRLVHVLALRNVVQVEQYSTQKLVNAKNYVLEEFVIVVISGINRNVHVF